MNRVFIVVDTTFANYTVLRVFATNSMAIAYGEALVAEGSIDEFDVYEREVY